MLQRILYQFMAVLPHISLMRLHKRKRQHKHKHKWNESAEHCYNVQRNSYSIDKEQQSK